MTAPWIAAFLALTLLVLAQWVVLLGVLSRTAQLMERLEARLREAEERSRPAGLAPGSPLPALPLLDHEGRLADPPEPRGQAVVYLLLSPGCPPCERLLREIGRDGTEAPPVPVVGVTDLQAAAALRNLRLPPWFAMRYQDRGEVSRAFQSITTPHAFAVDGRGLVAAVRVPGGPRDLYDLGASLQG